MFITKNIWRKNRFSFDSKIKSLDVGRCQGQGFQCCLSTLSCSSLSYSYILLYIDPTKLLPIIFVLFSSRDRNHRTTANIQGQQTYHFFLIFPNIPQCGHTAQLRNINNTLTSCIIVFRKKKKKRNSDKTLKMMLWVGSTVTPSLV